MKSADPVHFTKPILNYLRWLQEGFRVSLYTPTSARGALKVEEFGEI